MCVCSELSSVSVFSVQDEKYNHIDESEMKKVEKSVNEVMEWMNNVMNAQAKRNLDQDPVVCTREIRAKVKVSISFRLDSVSLTHGVFPYKSLTSSGPVLASLMHYCHCVHFS